MSVQFEPLSDYRERYSDRAVLVGSGPTLFDYTKLSELNCPVFFINDTVAFEKYVECDSFFSTHHRPLFTEKVFRSKFLYPLSYLRPEIEHPYRHSLGPFVNSIPYQLVTHCTKQENDDNVPISCFPFWSKDRDWIDETGWLLGHTGSITSTIHFIWYCGFTELTLIGCNPVYVENHHHDSRISATSGRKGSLWDLPAIIENQKRFLDHFEFKLTYTGDFEYWKTTNHPSSLPQ